MNFKKILLSLMGITILASCASFNVMPSYTQSKGETDAGTSLKAYTGDILYTKYDYRSIDFARPSGQIDCGMGCEITLDGVNKFNASSVNGQYGACGNARFTGMAGAGQITYLCLTDANRDGMFEGWAHPQRSGKLKNPIIYSMQTAEEVDGVKKELIYQGRDDETLRFRYREYIKNVVRPAFDQTVEYNLTEDKLVTFRGMKILVESASNQEINYRIISGTIEL